MRNSLFSSKPELLAFPYPYRSMIAIESDIDATALQTFRETMRFLRTDAETQMGEGLGLDVSSSFWVYGPNPDGVVEDRMLYMRSERDPSVKTHYADELEHYIRCGWLSSLHTYGRTGAGFSRDQAAKALDILAGIGG